MSHPTPPSTMRAAVREQYGSTDVVHVDTVPVPTAGPRQVLVEVAAAGLDRGVWHLMAGLPYLVRAMGFGLKQPKNPILGVDVAGRVAAVGTDVTSFQPGDEVYGIADGSFAEYVLADEAKLSPKPASLTFEQAAAVPVSGLTALQALTDVGQAEAGQRVLIIGASGGVGSYAVQVATSLGTHVTGVASASKADLVASLGADEVIDYTSESFTDRGAVWDLVVDIGGRNSIATLRSALRPDGTLVIVGGEGGGRWTGGFGRQLRAVALSPFVGQRLTTFVSPERSEDLARLTELIDSGHVTPAVDHTYALDEVPDAIRRLVAGDVRGKAVITISH